MQDSHLQKIYFFNPCSVEGGIYTVPLQSPPMKNFGKPLQVRTQNITQNNSSIIIVGKMFLSLKNKNQLRD